MSIMAKYARIFWVDPKDEEVGRRNRAVADIRNWLAALSSTEAVELAGSLSNAVAGGALAEYAVEVVEKAIVAAGSDAFVREGKDAEILVCALVAALDLVRSRPVSPRGWSAADALAAGLWSSLSFQSPIEKEGIEMLRHDVLTAAQDRVMEVAEAARVRTAVPEIGPLVIPETAPTGSKANTAFKKATAPLVDALRDNAELDREEIDFLWWAMSDWSEHLKLPLSALENTARAVVAGLAGGERLRKLPASGHLHVVLRAVNTGDETTLAQAVAALAEYREALLPTFQSNLLEKSRPVFPLLSTLSGANPEIPGATEPRSARDWGGRALLEAGILHLEVLRAG